MRAPGFFRLSLGLIGSLLLLMQLAGCSSISTPADLVISNGDEPQTLDPALITGQLEGRLCMALFEGLTTRNAQGEIIPGMAERWEISPDGRTYTFHLRADAQWSNGAPLTAHDFADSWQRLLRGGFPYKYQLFYVVHAEDYAEGKITDFSQVGIQVPDDHTLIVTLKQPVAYFLELTSMQTLCPVYLPSLAQNPRDWIKPGNLVSNGPYVLKEWWLRNYILIQANPHYWRPVAIQRIKVLPTDNANTTFNLFYSHKTDLVIDKSSIPATLIQDIKSKPYFHANPFGATAFLRYNLKRSPFADVRVRQALALAIRKQDIVDKVTRAGEAIAQSFVPPGPFPYHPAQAADFNPDEARRLLAEAGYPGGKNFPELTLLFPPRGTALGVCTELQAQWREVLGITSIHLRAQEWKVYLQSQQNVDYDLSYSSWVGDYSDPQTFLDMFVTDGGNNDTGWSNPQYDKLLADAEATPDQTKRMQMMHDMEQLLVVQDQPITPLYFYVGMSLYDPDKVGGYLPNFVDDHRWGALYIPEKK